MTGRDLLSYIQNMNFRAAGFSTFLMLIITVTVTTSEELQASLCEQDPAQLSCTYYYHVLISSIDVIKAKCMGNSSRDQCCRFEKQNTLIRRICLPTDEATIGGIFKSIDWCHSQVRQACIIPNLRNSLKEHFPAADLMTFYYECPKDGTEGNQTCTEASPPTSPASLQLSTPSLTTPSPSSSTTLTLQSTSTPTPPSTSTSTSTTTTTTTSSPPSTFLSTSTSAWTSTRSTSTLTSTSTSRSSTSPSALRTTEINQLSTTLQTSNSKKPLSTLQSSTNNAKVTVSSIIGKTANKAVHSGDSQTTIPMKTSKVLNVTAAPQPERIQHATTVPGVLAAVAVCVLVVLTAIGILTSKLLRSHLKGKQWVYPARDVHDANPPLRYVHIHRPHLP